MAFPFTFEEGFEAGTLGSFDSETDTQSQLDYPHYAALAKIPGAPMPYRGAYCMRVALSNVGTNALVTETGSWDIASDGALYFRFMVWVDSNLVSTMANGDEFTIFDLLSGSGQETKVVLNYTTANGFRVGIGELTGTSLLDMPTNQWVAIEVYANIDDVSSNDGTIDLWVDGGQSASQVTSLDQASITSGRLGVFSVASTITANIYFDDVLADDGRLYSPIQRYPSDVVMTKSGHAFVGPGCIENVTLLSGAGTDNVVTLYDTDTGATADPNRQKLILNNINNSEVIDPAGMPVNFNRGCYVALSGTNPRATIKLGGVSGYGSEGAIRSYGIKRLAAGIDS